MNYFKHFSSDANKTCGRIDVSTARNNVFISVFARPSGFSVFVRPSGFSAFVRPSGVNAFVRPSGVVC